jgi:hypothetical protein
MSKELIPYVIMESYPDYKRPHILPIFGMSPQDKLDDVLLKKLVDFVYDRIDIENLNSVEDIEYFWENYYNECYMDNTPWEATAIIDGVWENVNPSNESLFKALIKEKNKCYISSDENDNDEESVKSSETEESIIIEETNEENTIPLILEKIFNS